MTRFVVNRETRHLTGWHRWHFWSNWKKQTSEKLKFKPITTAKPDKAICFAHWWNRYGNGSLTNRNFKFTFYSAIAKEGRRKWMVECGSFTFKTVHFEESLKSWSLFTTSSLFRSKTSLYKFWSELQNTSWLRKNGQPLQENVSSQTTDHWLPKVITYY